MLKSLKILKKTSISPYLPFSYLSFVKKSYFAKSAKDTDPEEVIQKRNKMRYLKREANREIAEALFFPDQTQKTIQDFIFKKL